MNSNNLRLEAIRKQMQKTIKGRSITNKEIILKQDEEIEQYRKRLTYLSEYIERENYKNNDNKANCITVKMNLEAEEFTKGLENIKRILSDIEEKAFNIGIDLGQEKDYTTVQTYVNEKLVKEETTQYK